METLSNSNGFYACLSESVLNLGKCDTFDLESSFDRDFDLKKINFTKDAFFLQNGNEKLEINRNCIMLSGSKYCCIPENGLYKTLLDYLESSKASE